MTQPAGAAAFSFPGIAAVAVRRAWPWRARRVRVEASGVWHLQQPGGGWLSIRPDRLDFGPARAWLSVGGPVHSRSARARHARRVRVTLWRPGYDADTWRRLQIAARWCASAAPHPGRRAP
ncbi:hypothetical protein FOZ76_10115 [Verticiella sediminum]|uniref:Uncharacterized protein n=1 Tax=Verticiella sediminum TaxID=1247510 RepID=A0A556AS22_9BURK|nr:hypothetical protein [Verticiella sediminum]TSH95742.1 hypothetical protein FOZ76_10115 [Verticiella sediminum]